MKINKSILISLNLKKQSHEIMICLKVYTTKSMLSVCSYVFVIWHWPVVILDDKHFILNASN
jgi:hypothetical protein